MRWAQGPDSFGAQQTPNGAYGMAVTATGSSAQIEFSETTESFAGSGIPGTFYVVALLPGVIGGETVWTNRAPSDGKQRYLRAREFGPGANPSDYTPVVSGLPWGDSSTIGPPAYQAVSTSLAITSINTVNAVVATNVSASGVVAGTFGNGDFTFPNDLTVNGSASFGGGDVIVGSGSTAVVLIDGTDGVVQPGHNGIAENGGNLVLSARGGVQLQLDNDANSSTTVFSVGSQGNNSNLFQLDELGHLSLSGSISVGALGANAATGAMDVRAGSITAFGDFRDYLIIRTSPNVATDGGILLTNNLLTNGAANSWKINSTFNNGTSARLSIGLVNNTDTETFLSGTALQILANGNIALAQNQGGVAIGKATPTTDFDVAGNTAVTGTLFVTTNVGIGKPGASTTLDVNGNTFITGTLTTTSDVSIGSEGAIDSTKTPVTDQLFSFNGSKWVPRTVQLSFTNGVVSAGNLADGTAVALVNTNPVLSGTPSTPPTPTLTPLYNAMLVDVGAPPAAGSEYIIDYSVNSGSFTSGSIVTTGQRVVHSGLTQGKSYAYKVAAKGATPTVYSAATNYVSPSTTAETNAYGIILANQIAVTTLAAINANLGDITTGRIQNFGSTAGILFGGFALPAAWSRFIDFTASGSSPFLYVSGANGPAVSISANGSASFVGSVQANALTVNGPSEFNDALNADGQNAIIGNVTTNNILLTPMVSESNPGAGARIVLANDTLTAYGWTPDLSASFNNNAAAIVGTYTTYSGSLVTTSSAAVGFGTENSQIINGTSNWVSASVKPSMSISTTNSAYNQMYALAGQIHLSGYFPGSIALFNALGKVTVEYTSSAVTGWTPMTSPNYQIAYNINKPTVSQSVSGAFTFLVTDGQDFTLGTGASLRFVYWSQVQALQVTSGAVFVNDNNIQQSGSWVYTLGNTLAHRGVKIPAQQNAGTSETSFNLEPLTTQPPLGKLGAGDVYVASGSWNVGASGSSFLNYFDGNTRRGPLGTSVLLGAGQLAVTGAMTASAGVTIPANTLTYGQRIRLNACMMGGPNIIQNARGLDVSVNGVSNPFPNSIVTALGFATTGSSTSGMTELEATVFYTPAPAVSQVTTGSTFARFGIFGSNFAPSGSVFAGRTVSYGSVVGTASFEQAIIGSLALTGSEAITVSFTGTLGGPSSFHPVADVSGAVSGGWMYVPWTVELLG